MPIVNPKSPITLTLWRQPAYTRMVPHKGGSTLVKSQVLAALEEARGHYLSGQDLAQRLGVSRTAIWKAVAALRTDGVPIEAVTNRGYALSADADLLHADAITALLTPEAAKELRIEVYDRLPGTNAALRARADATVPEGLVLIAQAQSAGRGRSGRSFFSPPGGLYLSLLLRPELAARQAVFLTVMAAVAAARACEAVCGGTIQIKWVNDLWKDGKKVCGILTEASMDVESGLLEYAIVGLGFNLLPPPDGWPAELQGIAGSLLDGTPPSGARTRLAAAFLNEFWSLYRQDRRRDYLPDYRARQVLPGHLVEVRPGRGTPYRATAVALDEECRLLVRPEGSQRFVALQSGEVQILPAPNL